MKLWGIVTVVSNTSSITLLVAKQRQLIESVRPRLDALILRAGLWVGDGLYQRVLRQAGES